MQALQSSRTASRACASSRQKCSKSSQRHTAFSGHAALKTLRSITRVAASEQREAEALSQDSDVEAKLEEFMKKQAELESGAAFARTVDVEQVIGGDEIPEEVAKKYCRDIVEILKTLRQTRDMSVNEARLIVSIEDPREKQKRGMGIEDERGVSRDEMAAALLDVAEGRIPRDRIALKCLFEDISNWPFMDVDEQATQSAALKAASGGIRSKSEVSGYAALKDGSGIAKPYVMGDKAREGDKPQSITDMLPDWVGLGTLYGISALPAMFAVAAILVLFYNSLR